MDASCGSQLLSNKIMLGILLFARVNWRKRCHPRMMKVIDYLYSNMLAVSPKNSYIQFGKVVYVLEHQLYNNLLDPP